MVELMTENLKEELAETYNLGILRKEYKITRTAVIIGIVLTTLGLLIYGILFWMSFSEPGDIARNMLLYGLIPLGILAGIGIPVLFLGNRWVSRRYNWRIYVYEHGLIYNGNDVFAVRWSSVKSVIHKITEQTTTDGEGVSQTSYSHKYTIFCYDGTELGAKGIINGTFAGKDELIHIIEQESAPYLLEEALKNYKAGNDVHFGVLNVNQTGITLAGQTLVWQDLKKFDIKGTKLSFWKQHKWTVWKSCEMGDIVNYEAFKRLVSTIQSETLINRPEEL